MKKGLSWSIEGRKLIHRRFIRLKEDAANIFHYSSDVDAQILDFISLPAIALSWSAENPLWCQVIGAPGAGKTAHISLFESWENAKFVSRLSKNSLISGYRSEVTEDDGSITEEDPSFLPALDGKMLVIKDFTCILQGPREERDSVIGQLRDIYDGSASRVLGNVGFVEYKSRFNMLLAVTNIIDGFHSINQQLGERFICRRESSVARLKITTSAFDNILSGTFKEKIKSYQKEYLTFVDRLPLVPMTAIEWPEQYKAKAVKGADLIAMARSHVQREHNGRSIATRPSPEVGTRLVTQIAQTVSSWCVLNGYSKVNRDAWAFGGARLLRDTLPTVVSWILYHAYNIQNESQVKTKISIKELIIRSRLGFNTTSQVVEDLFFNGIFEISASGRKVVRNVSYRIKDDVFNTIKQIGLFVDFDKEANLDEIPTLIKGVKSKERGKP